MVLRRPRRSLAGAAGVALALALAHGPAHAGPPAQDTGDLAAEGQARREAGDTAGAIERWQRALASLPVTQATAHRRAGLVLAIAAAHEHRFQGEGDSLELRRALEVLDGYLAGLDPTDDENRVAVEQRRTAVADALARADAPGAAGGPTVEVVNPRAPDRRLWVAGGTVVGLGAASLAVLGLGLGLGAGADRALREAVALPGDDPGRDAAKARALGRGQRANDAALAGGVIGAVLLVTGVALLVAGVTRARAVPRRARLHGAGLGLVLTF